MKRSPELIYAETPIKKAVPEEDDSSTSTTSSTIVYDDVLDNPSLDVDEPLQIVHPNDIELTQAQRDVIRSTLSMLRNTNIYDWTMDEDYDWMYLYDKRVVQCSDDQFRECDIFVKLARTPNYTFCNIRYVLDDDMSEYIRLEWPTPCDDPPFLTIILLWQERYCFFFQREQTNQYELEVEDGPDYHWCYFPDIRLHLNRISP